MSTLSNTLAGPLVAARPAKYVNILSRALIAAIFLISAIGKLSNFGVTVGYAAQAGLPAPQLAIAAAIVFELVGGGALLLGYRPRLAALILIVFLIPATLIFHAAQIGDPVHGQDQMIQVLKNLAIIGGLLSFVGKPERAEEASYR
jgi:Predicted membrane protein